MFFLRLSRFSVYFTTWGPTIGADGCKLLSKRPMQRDFKVSGTSVGGGPEGLVGFREATFPKAALILGPRPPPLL